MTHDPEPKTLTRLKVGAEHEGEGLTKQNQERPATVGWIVPENKKDKLDAEEIIGSLITEERRRGQMAVVKLAIWLLSGLAYSALLIIVLLGLGTITLPTALVFALVGSLLSLVVGLLRILVKYLSQEKE